MGDDSKFFDSVFEDPEDDPLLGDEEPSSDPSARPDKRRAGAPSWMGGPGDATTDRSSPDEARETGPNRKEIVVDQSADDRRGLDALNEAISQGWKMVRLSVSEPGDESGAAARGGHRFVVVLEQEGPQSLFDFGAEA